MRWFLKKRTHMRLLLCGVVLFAFGIPHTAFAHTRPELEKKVSVTLSCEFEDAAFSLYRVADLSEDVAFTLSGDFAEYPVSLENLDSDGWHTAARTLAAYVQRDGKKAVAEGKTDEKGKLQFENLAAGLYLVTGGLYEKGDFYYEPSSALISLPNLTADDAWDYDPVISPKYEKHEKDKQLSVKVTKKWSDSGNEKNRPANVTAQLLKDGKVQEEVKLNKANNWTHTWKKLEAGHKWAVTEKKPGSSYQVKVEKSGKNFVITNTFQGTGKNPNSTPGGNNPGGNQTGGGSPGAKLPQTGQLWWPVPYLIVAGIFLILLGVLRRQRESYQ